MIQFVSFYVNYFVYFVVIWVGVFFMCLPLFNPTPPKNPRKGHATSAPAKPQMGKKLLLSLIISLIILLSMVVMQKIGWLPTIGDFDKNP